MPGGSEGRRAIIANVWVEAVSSGSVVKSTRIPPETGFVLTGAITTLQPVAIKEPARMVKGGDAVDGGPLCRNYYCAQYVHGPVRRN